MPLLRLTSFLTLLAERLEQTPGQDVVLTRVEAEYFAHESRNYAWIVMNKSQEGTEAPEADPPAVVRTKDKPGVKTAGGS